MLSLELGDVGSVERMVEVLEERTGGVLDVLINNVGFRGTAYHSPPFRIRKVPDDGLSYTNTLIRSDRCVSC